jgi:hypothetical protein
MDEMNPHLGIMLIGALGVVLVILCALATALALPLTRDIASWPRRVVVAGLAALGLTQAVLWLAAPSWWHAAPAENLPALLLAQAIVCGAMWLAGGTAASTDSREA